MGNTMKKIELELRKRNLLSFIEGHKKANELIRSEKKKRLCGLTEKDSMAQYDALCKMWEKNQEKGDLERLDKQKISFLMERRQRFNDAGDLRKSK